MNHSKRYFVDIRGGCAAVRDSEHPDYNSDYQGLHQDTIDVVEYRHGFQNPETNSWDMKKEDVDYLNNLCEELNRTCFKVKDNFTREEVIDLIKNNLMNEIDMIYNGQAVSYKDLDKWIDENL